MRRLAIAVAITVGAAGCGSSTSTPAPSSVTVFTVPLSATNENPPITNAEKDAKGTAVITINSQTNTIDFNVSLNGFTSTSVVNIAHIHGPNAPAGVNAGILVNTSLTPGTVTLSNGAGTFSFPSVSASADTINQILANPQNFYFNVHTALNGGGAIRGQLR
jgi:ABC-type glycerol-3-phosphate transport system substrate-binding protein